MGDKYSLGSSASDKSLFSVCVHLHLCHIPARLMLLPGFNWGLFLSFSIELLLHSALGDSRWKEGEEGSCCCGILSSRRLFGSHLPPF
jgi:hypothetical protein